MLTKKNIRDIYTLSPMQEGMFFHTLYDKGSPVYFEQRSYRYDGDLDAAAVKKSLEHLVDRYDILRTVFVRKKSKRLLQVVLKQRDIDFYYRDITGEEDPGEYVRRYKEVDRARSFDLGKDMLMRVALFQTAPSCYVFVWSYHHILMDGWCLGILISEYTAIYESQRTGKPYDLPEVTPYRTYIDWLEKQNKEEARKYWSRYLEGYGQAAPVPLRKRVGSGEAEEGYLMQREDRELSKETSTKLEQMARGNRITLNTIVRGAWGLLLGKYNAIKEVVYGAVVSGRPTAIRGIERMVGLFINTVPVRIGWSDETPLDEFLTTLHRQANEGENYNYYPLMEIQTQSALKNELITHIMAFENYPTDGNDYITRISDLQVFGQTNYDFNIVITPGERIMIRLEYNGKAYDAKFIEIISTQYRHLLEQVAEKEKQKISSLEYLSAEEKKQYLHEYNATDTLYPQHKTIRQIFEEQVEKAPERNSIQDSGRGTATLTYGQLNRQAGKLARYLRRRGIKTGTIAAVMMERSPMLIIALMALLKTEAAYLPIDPAYPLERKNYILDDSKATALLTTGTVAEDVSFDREIINPDTLKELQELNELHELKETQELKESGEIGASKEPVGLKVCYIIYTSGSTGKPKGVAVEHRGVTNYITWAARQYAKGEPADFPFYTSISFDLTVTSIYTPLVTGGKIVVYPEGEEDEQIIIHRIIDDNKVTAIKLTPSHLKQLRTKKETSSKIRVLVVGGEQLDTELAEAIHRNYEGKIEIYNEYGPTEATVGSMIHQYEPGQNGTNTVPIGKPAANTQIYLLDENRNPVPVGGLGELYIAGDGLALGYINKPELTAERFEVERGPWLSDESTKAKVYEPEKGSQSQPPGTALQIKAFGGVGTFSRKGSDPPEAKLYKTGDLARWLPGANIEYCRRVDGQIKIRGYRIETGEIRNRLLQNKKIDDAQVLARKDRAGEYDMCAYIVTAEPIEPTEIKAYLGETLPGYMVPTNYTPLPAIPLTPSRKPDTKALEVYGTRATAAENEPPRGEMQEIVAAVWKEVLETDKVGMRDNFFDLGGNSIKILQVHGRLNDLLNREIPLMELFRSPTIRALSDYLAPGKNDEMKTGTRGTGTEPRKDERSEAAEVEKTKEIAVIGMAGRFPGARNIDQYLENLKNGTETIRGITPEELEKAGVEPAQYNENDYVPAGGILEDAQAFDSTFFGYTPAEAKVMNPQTRLFHEIAWQALEDAGYVPGNTAGAVGVYAGASTGTIWEAYNQLTGQSAALGQFEAAQLTDKDFLATRVSYKLDLRGPAYMIRSACSTSLAAVHQACSALREGECEMALAGGVSVSPLQNQGYTYREGMIFSPDGHCRAFDAEAKGTVAGNGVGIVVLKKLEKARADNDNIYAIIKGSACNNDGNRKLGYTAPSIEGQAEAIREAMRKAQVEPESIGYIE
ncbi:MAG: amino acid adenylation domain-containing protein, partial [bacterium]|nr:amino acid adenylation domain-containing protein [bacterium]